MTKKEMEKKVAELKELQQMQRELEEEITKVQNEIKKEMDMEQVEELAAGLFTVRWKTIMQSRFDTKTFKEAHADLYRQYMRQTATRRFSVA